MALDDVVILNVDTNTLETPFDDLQSLPNDVVGNEPLGSDPVGGCACDTFVGKVVVVGGGTCGFPMA